ncbi:hypothetical protein Tter_0549 [Thermobaculum terrenum ATCC BAA-798]|uniref:Uncharacterized protein n=1 Tax=Thermobaculum terrenum (strain ATCC BAA-798 / CCMEE 7001 / YNP1) TaxID=525904 RepID=D1CEW1_THET1|nr:hypothetical protein Tter_0549 [Thermobaculum terrenum ATCC BAA-798]
MKGQQSRPFSPWGHPLVEESLFCVLTRVHGLGRALAVAWVPLLFDHRVTLLENLQGLRAYRPCLHRWHGYGLLVLALGLTIRCMLLH